MPPGELVAKARFELGGLFLSGVLELATGLEKELITAKEELQVLVRKERESRVSLGS